MAEQLMKKDGSAEEKKYAEAEGLVDAIPCIIRFERKVSVLKSAAKKFDALGDYNDAKKRSSACRTLAKEVQEQGYQAVLEKGAELERKAVSKSDYMAAIEEYRRAVKSENYREEVKKHIQSCRERIRQINTKEVWKRRAIAAGILVLFLILFMQTPGYPFVKGFLYQKQGRYEKALGAYENAYGIPFTEGRKKACYYEIGKKCLKTGKKQKALQYFVKADDYANAAKKAAQLECEILQEKQVGDELIFGDMRWNVLEKTESAVLLQAKHPKQKMSYSETAFASWEQSLVYEWLNEEFINEQFTKEERKLLFGKNTTKENRPLFILDKTEYVRLQENMAGSDVNCWLRQDAFMAQDGLYYDKSGEIRQTISNDNACYVRPAVWVAMK